VQAPRRAIANVVFVALVATWFVAFRPTVLFNGPTSAVIVQGTSMEPTYHTGDVVLTRTASSYGVGDVIAFRVSANANVIHRIIAVNDNGFVTQGDNRDGPDRWTPKQTDVVGRAWAVIPHAGGLLAWARHRIPLALLVTIGALMTTLPSRRRRHRLPQPSDDSLRSTIDVVLGAAGSLAVAGAVMAAVAYSWSPTRLVDQVDVLTTQHLAVSYQVSTRASDLYPNGVLGPVSVTGTTTGATTAGRTGGSITTNSTLPSTVPSTLEAFYRTQSQTLTVDMAWSADPTAADLTGTAQLIAEVSSPDGWSRELSASAPQSFTGNAWNGTIKLDVAEAFAKVDRLAALTESVRAVTLSFRAKIFVQADADADGGVKATWNPSFDLEVNGNVVSPQPLASDRSDITRVVSVTTDRRLFVGSLSMTVNAARALGLSLLAIGTVAMTAGWLARRRLVDSAELDQVLAPLMVTISTPPRTEEAVEVASASDLQRLAREVGVVMRSPGRDGVVYLVRLDDQLFAHWPNGRPASLDLGHDRAGESVSDPPIIVAAHLVGDHAVGASDLPADESVTDEHIRVAQYEFVFDSHDESLGDVM
jgi:signal peptidase I